VQLNGNGSENFIEVTTTGDKLFGGTAPGGGGGISGVIDFYRGLDTQQPDDYLSLKQGRIVTDQSGIGYTFSGVGNGTIASLAAGTSSLVETITITAVGIDTNPAHSTYQHMRFDVVGSISGSISNSVANAEGSHACWADQAFSSSRINFTINRGSTQFSNGDVFTVKTLHSHVAPAYPGLCYAALKQLYVGTSNYLKPMAFIVRRCPDPLAQGAGVANISGDANPVLAIYELLTDLRYGLGIPAVRIDAAGFEAAAVICSTEGLGISMQFDQQASADQLIGEILRHCDGVLYSDPQTGLWSISLARGGYDPTTLPLLTVDSAAVVDFSRGNWRETSNEVTIRFTSRSNNFNNRMVKGYDAANVRETGEVRPQTIDFKGISSEAAAALVAIRVLKTLTYPLSKLKIVANRTAWKFRPGGLFRLTWVPLGIVNQVFRITRISYGSLTDGKINMDAVEDIFGINSTAFVAPPSSGWVNPAGAPLPNSHERLMEIPADILNIDGQSISLNVMAMASPADGVAADSYEVWRDDGAGYADSGINGPFCPWGKLAAPYPAATVANDPVGFTVDGATGIGLVLLESCSAADNLNGVNLALLDDEIIGWQTKTLNPDGSYSFTGILRGLMDTVPVDHAANAPIFFFSVGAVAISAGGFVDGQTVIAKLLPQNSAGILPLGSATALTLVTGNPSRCEDPYPPGNVRMQGAPYGTRYTTIVGPLTITFSPRNSDEEIGKRPLVLQDQSTGLTFPTGSGTQATLTVVGGSGGGGVVTSPYVISGDDRLALGGGHNPLKVQLKQFFVVGLVTFESFQQQTVQVIFTGFGFCFGEYFGGIQN
jgi:hypothetical protein